MNNSKVQSILNHVTLATIGLFFSLIQGCAGASSVNMVPDSYDIIHKLDSSVKVVVDGSKIGTGRVTGAQIYQGKTTVYYGDHVSDWERLFMRLVSDSEIKKALKESLAKSGVFSRVSQSSDSDYLLKMEIVSVPVSATFLTGEAALYATWTLTDLKSNTDVWQEVVRSESKTPPNICLGNYIRTRGMFEGVIKENIRLGINQLSEAMTAN